MVLGDSISAECIREGCRKRPVTFAQWRWGTLYECLKFISHLEGVDKFWDKNSFSKMKDRTTLNLVDRAFRTAAFWEQVLAMLEIAGVFNAFQKWALGCCCHDDERMAGKIVLCPKRTLRAPELPEKVEQIIRECIRRASNTDPNLAWSFEPEVVQAYRVAAASLQGSFAFITELPYSLMQVQTHRREYALALIAEFDALPAGTRHHRVTLRFVKEGGEFRERFQATNL